jgi:hypothetical protein
MFFFFFFFFFSSPDIPVEEQGLSFHNTRLQDDHIIGSYGIEYGSVIDLVKPYPKIQIVVKTTTGKLIPVDLNSGDSVRMIKEKIERLENIPISDQSLSLKGARLDDDKMIQSYNMEKGTVVDLMTSSSTFQINVKAPSGKKIPVDVKLESSIQSVKEQIAEKEGAFVLFVLFE